MSKEAGFVSRVSEYPCLLCLQALGKPVSSQRLMMIKQWLRAQTSVVAGIKGFESELQDPDCEKDLLISKEEGSGFFRGLLDTY